MRCAAVPQVLKLRKLRPYIPDFKLAFEHFCIHTGGAGVIEEIEKQLRLRPESVKPSQETLYRYGNTSSSSIWCAPPPEPRTTAVGLVSVVQIGAELCLAENDLDCSALVNGYEALALRLVNSLLAISQDPKP